jgi:hypothetical protein
MSLPRINYVFPYLDMIVSLLLVYSHDNDHKRNYGQDMLFLLHNFSPIYICTVSKFYT